MSHVDEGALHAYLDGALDEYPAAEARRIRDHVETCAECAERLAAERAVREEAHAILGRAAPQVAVPTFEELRAYVVRTSRAERTTMSVRLYRLSWAASVVLALGTGWMLRGERAMVVAPLERSGGAGVAGLEQQLEQQQEQEQERDAQPTDADAVRLRSVEERAASAPAEVQLSAAPSQAPASALDVARNAVASVADVPAGARAEVAQSAAPLVDARDFNDVVADAGTVGLAAGAAGAAPPQAPAPQPTSTRVAERIDSAARASQPERRVAAQDQVVSSSLSADQGAPAFRQRPANERVATDEEEPVSLVVPGLEVLDVLPVGQGTAFAGVRALQRLESGDTLELVHLPEQVDPSLLPPLRPGTNELVRQTGSGWLVMRAPVTERYLQELLQRLEGGR